MNPASIVVLTGPTAAGKSRLALQLAAALGGEIVSADSMQVYRHLDIGTAKPSPQERARVPHHLVDFLDLREAYNAGRFVADADAAIAAIAKRGAVPVVCGGTGLYLRALLHGLVPAPPRDEALRRQLHAAWEAGEGESLWRELIGVDPVLAARLHPNDRARVLRGLEVWRLAGRPLSSYQAQHGFRPQRLRALQIAVTLERPQLYRQIDQRVLEMLEAGWLAEVEGVLAAGYPTTLPPLQAIGYRQLCAYVEGGGELSAVVAEIQKQTRRFAKRQLTWLRRAPVHWFSPDQVDAVLGRARKFLQTSGSSL